MNLPNKITIFRVILVPVFVVLMLCKIDAIPYQYIIACVVFCIACLSDFFDGYLARKYNLVSNFGKFMDPLADKLLVGSALICFVELDIMPAWMVIIIIGREFIVSGIRLIAADNGVVIAASMWGKVKTNVQMFMSIFMILQYEQVGFLKSQWFAIVINVLMYAAVILTVISLIDYAYKYREILLK